MVSTRLISPNILQFTARNQSEKAPRPVRDVSGFAAKRLYRIAQAFSPGLGG
jgi:hypothetical protein